MPVKSPGGKRLRKRPAAAGQVRGAGGLSAEPPATDARRSVLASVSQRRLFGRLGPQEVTLCLNVRCSFVRINEAHLARLE